LYLSCVRSKLCHLVEDEFRVDVVDDVVVDFDVDVETRRRWVKEEVLDCCTDVERFPIRVWKVKEDMSDQQHQSISIRRRICRTAKSR